ncbi:MAG: AAA family ATPase [Desulfobacterales bacterium]|nr:AAA family ATPase [Desulfobacterales bacterium]
MKIRKDVKSMYQAFYNLRRKPFQPVPNPAFLFMAEGHRDALAMLEHGVMERVGVTLLTGGVGAGKTTLIHRFLNNVRPDIRIGCIMNTNVTPDEFIELVSREFERPRKKEDQSQNLHALRRLLAERRARGRRAVLIVDEAQNLSDDVLEEIRKISGFRHEGEPLLQILLVGQTELGERLKAPGLTSFTRRIAAHYHLSSLGRSESVKYIDHRLAIAGGQPDLFTREAVELVHGAARGVPRVINLLCDAALVHGFADDLDRIDAGVVHQVIRDKKGLGLFPSAKPVFSRIDLPHPKNRARGSRKGPSLVSFIHRPTKKVSLERMTTGGKKRREAPKGVITIPLPARRRVG